MIVNDCWLNNIPVFCYVTNCNDVSGCLVSGDWLPFVCYLCSLLLMTPDTRQWVDSISLMPSLAWCRSSWSYFQLHQADCYRNVQLYGLSQKRTHRDRWHFPLDCARKWRLNAVMFRINLITSNGLLSSKRWRAVSSEFARLQRLCWWKMKWSKLFAHFLRSLIIIVITFRLATSSVVKTCRNKCFGFLCAT